MNIKDIDELEGSLRAEKLIKIIRLNSIDL